MTEQTPRDGSSNGHLEARPKPDDAGERARSLADAARRDLVELGVEEDAIQTLAERFVAQESSTDTALFVEWVRRLWSGA